MAKKQEKQFRVKWEIDVWAMTPQEAAEKARATQLDPASTASFFCVEHRTAKMTSSVIIDLLENEESE